MKRFVFRVRRPRFAATRSGALALLLLCATLAPSAIGGTVRTLDGKVYDGDVRLDNGKVLVAPKRGEPTKLDLADVLSASFKSAEPPKPASPAPSVAVAQAWKTQDVGPTGTPGSLRAADGKLFVKGAGRNIKGEADSFFFAYSELPRDGTVIARLTDLQLVNPFEKAGVMIREGFNERGSRCAFLYLTPQDGSSFAWRGDEGATMTATPPSAADKAPAWLKLTRQRNVVTAYKSLDGETWVKVGEPQLLKAQGRVYAGLAVCSRDDNAACVATFEGAAVLPRVNDDPPPKTAATAQPGGGSGGAAASILHRAVVLRSGEVLGNASVEAGDDKTIHVSRNGKAMALPNSDVARLVLAPVSPQQLSRIPPAGTGALLARGDFIEGEFESLDRGRLRINSVVFGPKEFAAGSEAVVVVLHDLNAGAAQAPWVVRTNEGYVYMARGARIDRDALVVDDETAGTVRVPTYNLAEVKAGAGRFDPLADLRPSKVDVSPGMSSVAAYGPAAPGVTLAGQAADHGLLTQCGTALTFAADGKYKILLARVGVPDGVAPLVAARVTVLVDGKEAYHSPYLTSLDDAANLACPLAGAHQVAIRAETAGDVALPLNVVWADAVLVK